MKRNPIVVIIIVAYLCDLVHGTTTGCDDVVSYTPCRCEDSILYPGTLNINCSGMDMTTIPKKLPDQVLSIDFSNNFLVPERIYELCEYDLYSVSLANNHISKLPENQFSKCNVIDTLDLSNNEIELLREGSLTGLHSLRSLVGIEARGFERIVFSNLISLLNLNILIQQSIIPGDLFNGLGLESMELVVNGALTLPVTLFNKLSSTLKSLTISSTSLQWLKEEQLAKLSSLTHFKLSGSTIRQIPYSLFKSNQNLTSITLADMASIPRNIFTNLSNLISLKLHDLEDMPSELFQGLFQLQSLEVSKCTINQIPEGWFQDMYNLEELVLKENGLSELKEEDFKNLHSLKVLDLSGNAIRDLTNGVIAEVAETVEVVNLSNNMLKVIHAGNLAAADKLISLDLSNNQIHTVESDAFNDLDRLQMLILASNKLSDIPADLFATNNMLNYLVLSANIIGELPDGLFGKTTQLRTLDLSENIIRNFGPYSQYPTQTLSEIDFSYNPVVCDCDLYEFVQGIPHTRVLGKCAKPESGIFISDFKPAHVCKQIISTSSTTPLARAVLVESSSSTAVTSSIALASTVTTSTTTSRESTTLTSSTLTKDRLDSTVTATSTPTKSQSKSNTSDATLKPQPLRMSTVTPAQIRLTTRTKLIPTTDTSTKLETVTESIESTSKVSVRKLEGTTTSDFNLSTTLIKSAVKMNSAVTEDTNKGIGNTTTTKTVHGKTRRSGNFTTNSIIPSVHPNVTVDPGEVVEMQQVTEESHLLAVLSIVGVAVTCILIIVSLLWKRTRRSRYEVTRSMEQFPEEIITVDPEIKPLKDVPSITIESIDAMDNVKVEVYEP